MFGIALAAAGLWTFCVASAPVLSPPAIAVFAALFVSDATVLLLVRHDWGPVDAALMLRLAWIGLWIRTAAEERPRTALLLLLGAVPAFLIYEKLNNVVLLAPLAVMLAVGGRPRLRRAAVAAIGFAIGLVPFAVVNAIGRGVSFAAARQPLPEGPAASVARYAVSTLELPAGDVIRAYILGVHAPLWMRAAETASGVLCAVFVVAVWWTRPRGTAIARLAVAALAAYAVTLASVAALFMRSSFPHHWFVATPFQYVAVACAAQALGQTSSRRGTLRVAAPLLTLVLAVRAVNISGVERDIGMRRTSILFDRSLTTIAQYAADHRDAATFIAADWGFGVQAYALSNGNLSMPEPFWQWGGDWTVATLEAAITAARRPTIVLASKERPPVSPLVTDDIVRSVDLISAGARTTIDRQIADLRAVRVVSFAPSSLPPPMPCTRAPSPPAHVRVETNSGGFVAVAWDAPAAGADRYLVDIGDAPGALRPVSRNAGRWPRFAAGGVPNGTYYLRVRAENACGISVASDELRVAVP
jgi:hypothetical protein